MRVETEHAVTRRFDVSALLDSRHTESAMQLINAITTAISPLSWVQNGGRTGSISEFNGYLIVRQTLDVQIAINDLVNSMKAAPEMRPASSIPPPALSDLPNFDHEVQDVSKKYWDAPPEFAGAAARLSNSWRLLGFLNDAMGRLRAISHMPRITKSNAAIDPAWAEGWLKFAAESRSIILLGSMEMHGLLNVAFVELSFGDNGAIFQKIFLLLDELGGISEISHSGALKIDSAGYARLALQAEDAWKEVRARFVYLANKEKLIDSEVHQHQATKSDLDNKRTPERPAGAWIETKEALALLRTALGSQGARLTDRQLRQRLDNLSKNWPKELRPHGKVDRDRFQKELDAVKATVGKPKAKKLVVDPTPAQLEERRTIERQRKLREKLDEEFPDDSAEDA
jgi:hypothetical protein